MRLSQSRISRSIKSRGLFRKGTLSLGVTLQQETKVTVVSYFGNGEKRDLATVDAKSDQKQLHKNFTSMKTVFSWGSVKNAFLEFDPGGHSIGFFF